jgi:hypothetical protein
MFVCRSASACFEALRALSWLSHSEGEVSVLRTEVHDAIGNRNLNDDAFKGAVLDEVRRRGPGYVSSSPAATRIRQRHSARLAATEVSGTGGSL